MTETVPIGKEDEEFRPVKIYDEEYPNYLIGNHGTLFSLSRNRALQGCPNNRGYIDYDLYKNGRRKKVKGHRLVAFGFVDNPHNYNVINHINERRYDNRSGNLEWCTQAYNVNYGDAQKRKAEKLSKPVIKLDMDHNIVAHYPSLIETSRQMGIPITSLWRACTYGTAQRGYLWAYVYKEEVNGICQ